MYCGTAKHYSLGEVQSAYKPLLAQAGRNGTAGRILGTSQDTPNRLG